MVQQRQKLDIFPLKGTLWLFLMASECLIQYAGASTQQERVQDELSHDKVIRHY